MKALLGERFWKRVRKLGPRACWEWTGARIKSGYGELRGDRRQAPLYAHRLSYEMHVDELMPGDVVRHRCDNPSCVNPLHLEVGTHKDNHLDCVARGRFKFIPRREGTEVHNARLNSDAVRQIRALRRGGESERGIARALGVSRNCVRSVLEKRTWGHVPDVVPEAMPG